jgi:N-acetylmuramoyl-L-alanine amidase
LASGRYKLSVFIENANSTGKAADCAPANTGSWQVSVAPNAGKSGLIATSSQDQRHVGDEGPDTAKEAAAKSVRQARVAPKIAPDERPVVVIDPGHGGADPGAVVGDNHHEKRLVLAVGLRLSGILRKRGRYRVVMTRDKDEYISLDDRIERSRSASGDLFISLHADSIDDLTQAAAIRGAAVYILSHKASDAEAKRVAEKENSADVLAGILPKSAAESQGVRNILVDLLKRETERESARLQTLLISAMRPKVAVAREPDRAAAFHVLKQTETPAVLIELGYMTNTRDLEQMSQEQWQVKMASAIAAAVDKFFQRK